MVNLKVLHSVKNENMDNVCKDKEGLTNIPKNYYFEKSDILNESWQSFSYVKNVDICDNALKIAKLDVNCGCKLWSIYFPLYLWLVC